MFNDGHGGEQIGTADAEGIDRDTDGRRENDVVVVMLGTNDIALNLSDGTGTYNQLRAFCAARRIWAKKLIVCTLPAWNTAQFANEDDRLTTNDLVDTNWAEFADRKASVGADADIGIEWTGAPAFLDNIHLDDDGHAIVAALVHTEILSL